MSAWSDGYNDLMKGEVEWNEFLLVPKVVAHLDGLHELISSDQAFLVVFELLVVPP